MFTHIMLRETEKLPLKLHSIEKWLNICHTQKVVFFRYLIYMKIDMPLKFPGENTEVE